MQALINPMKVDGVHNLVERAYRESGRMQFVREFYKNALEAGATRLEFGPEWCGVEATGVYRLMVADNGKGMDPTEIEGFLNTFGGGGKPIGEAHANYGIGAKTSTLPWNHHGIVVLSRKDGVDSMIWLCRDPNSGEYGARKFRDEEGTYDQVIGLGPDSELDIDWKSVMPDWIEDHGTVVVCLGMTGAEDTWATKGGHEDPFDAHEVVKYLNTRIWEIPEGLEVRVTCWINSDRATWPTNRTAGSVGFTTRRAFGAKRYVETASGRSVKGKLDSKGTVALADGTEIDWYLWAGQRPKIHGYAHAKGFRAALYQDELYDVTNHHSAFRAFGFVQRELRERLTLIARPPLLDGVAGVYPDTARTSLRVSGRRRAGEPLPWREWADEFAQNMPPRLAEAMLKSMGAASGSIRDDKWRQRLAERFGKRWKRDMFLLLDGASARASAVEPGNRETPTRPKVKRASPSGGTGATRGALRKGVDGSDAEARPSRVPGGVPEYRWVGAEDSSPGHAAVWVRRSRVHPAGCVYMNREFFAFVEVVRHWQGQFAAFLGEQVELVVQEVYGEAMVARLAHSESLKRRSEWGRTKVETQLRSEAALTMAALGLISEDHVIESRLKKLVSVKASP